MPSFRSQLIKYLLKTYSPKGKVDDKMIYKWRKRIDISLFKYTLPKGVQIKATLIGNITGEWVIPPIMASKCVLYYVHGGGYCIGSCNSHRMIVANLAIACKMRVLHINYRLAPEHPFPAAVEDCFTVYKELIAQGIEPHSLVIGGESAGGMLALTTLLLAKEQKLPMPAAMFCFSPHVDFTLQSASLAHFEKKELFYSLKDFKYVRTLYLKSADPSHYLISPLYSDLQGLPPLLVHAADPEMLLDDAKKLVMRAKAVGVKARLKLWKGLFHAFQLVPFLPESKQSIKEVAAFVQKYCK